jgi:hypothetical protein
MRLDRIQILALIIVAAAAWTSHAGVMREDFTVFLRHFVQDSRFRAKRITVPLSVDLSSSCEEEPNRSKEKWNRAAIAKKFIVPLDHATLAAEGLEQRITELASIEVSLFQFRDEADSYLITYTFRRRDGRWYLIAYEDASC